MSPEYKPSRFDGSVVELAHHLTGENYIPQGKGIEKARETLESIHLSIISNSARRQRGIPDIDAYVRNMYVYMDNNNWTMALIMGNDLMYPNAQNAGLFVPEQITYHRKFALAMIKNAPVRSTKIGAKINALASVAEELYRDREYGDALKKYRGIDHLFALEFFVDTGDYQEIDPAALLPAKVLLGKVGR